MLPFFSEVYANPASAHGLGQQAADAVKVARANVASLIGAEPAEIIFTSGATESNNLAITGLARALAGRSSRRRIVTTKIEHKAVLDPCKQLERQGYELAFLPVDGAGRVVLGAAREVISEDTLLVSVHAANNEIGTLQPIAELAAIAHDAGAVFHTDAVQAVGKVPVDVNAWEVDMLSLSAHKLYGPKGIGALYLHGGARGLPLTPLLLGGGQEQGVRPGTLNVAGIVGLGKACEVCQQVLAEEAARVSHLRDKLEQRLLAALPVRRNGDVNARLAGNSNLTFSGLDAQALLAHVPELALSTGSACTAGALSPSHVLQGIGMARADAASTVRIGLGRFTSEAEVDRAADLLIAAATTLHHLTAQ